MIGKLDTDDLDRIEQALATLSGLSPRGWAVVDDALIRVGNVQRDGVVGRGLTCYPAANHGENIVIAKAVATILNDAGALLMEIRRHQDAR